MSSTGVALDPAPAEEDEQPSASPPKTMMVEDDDDGRRGSFIKLDPSLLTHAALPTYLVNSSTYSTANNEPEVFSLDPAAAAAAAMPPPQLPPPTPPPLPPLTPHDYQPLLSPHASYFRPTLADSLGFEFIFALLTTLYIVITVAECSMLDGDGVEGLRYTSAVLLLVLAAECLAVRLVLFHGLFRKRHMLDLALTLAAFALQVAVLASSSSASASLRVGARVMCLLAALFKAKRVTDFFLTAQVWWWTTGRKAGAADASPAPTAAAARPASPAALPPAADGARRRRNRLSLTMALRSAGDAFTGNNDGDEAPGQTIAERCMHILTQLERKYVLSEPDVLRVRWVRMIISTHRLYQGTPFDWNVEHQLLLQHSLLFASHSGAAGAAAAANAMSFRGADEDTSNWLIGTYTRARQSAVSPAPSAPAPVVEAAAPPAVASPPPLMMQRVVEVPVVVEAAAAEEGAAVGATTSTAAAAYSTATTMTGEEDSSSFQSSKSTTTEAAAAAAAGGGGGGSGSLQPRGPAGMAQHHKMTPRSTSTTFFTTTTSTPTIVPRRPSSLGGEVVGSFHEDLLVLPPPLHHHHRADQQHRLITGTLHGLTPADLSLVLHKATAGSGTTQQDDSNASVVVVPPTAQEEEEQEVDVGTVDRINREMDEWDFDAFSIHSAHPLVVTLLSCIRKNLSLEGLGVPLPVLVNFALEIERGYLEANVYHNKTHAADVVQCFHYMLTHVQMRQCTTPLDRLAGLLACAVHDYNHPGVNNAFLLQTSHPLAIQYNDIAILESMHVSSAFQVMRAHPAMFDVFGHLPLLAQREARETMVQMVLATDMKSHFDILNQFKSAVVGQPQPERSSDHLGAWWPEFELQQQQQQGGVGGRSGSFHSFSSTQSFSVPHTALPIDYRRMVLKTALHCADVSNPARPQPLAVKLAELVQEEFFLQGDLEKLHKLPVSLFMDRDKPAFPKMQVGFIEFIVRPLVDTYMGWLRPVSASNKGAPEQCLASNLDYWKKRAADEQPPPPAQEAPASPQITAATAPPAAAASRISKLSRHRQQNSFSGGEAAAASSSPSLSLAAALARDQPAADSPGQLLWRKGGGSHRRALSEQHTAAGSTRGFLSAMVAAATTTSSPVVTERHHHHQRTGSAATATSPPPHAADSLV